MSDEEVVQVSDDQNLVSPWLIIIFVPKRYKPQNKQTIVTTKGRNFIASVKRSLCARWLDKILASFSTRKMPWECFGGDGEYCLALFGCFALFFPPRSGWISEWGWDSLKGLD